MVVYQTLSIECPSSIFFWDVLCVVVPLISSFLFVFVFVFMLSLEVFVNVPLIFSCQADYLPDWQPRKLLGIVEARSIN